MTQMDVLQTKLSVEGGFAPFNPYFYVPKYRSSDALPASQIFLFVFEAVIRTALYDWLTFYPCLPLFFKGRDDGGSGGRWYEVCRNACVCKCVSKNEGLRLVFEGVYFHVQYPRPLHPPPEIPTARILKFIFYVFIIFTRTLVMNVCKILVLKRFTPNTAVVFPFSF